MAGLLAHARRLHARPGVVRVSLLPGYAYADVDRLGFAVVVTGHEGAADEAADELAAEVWERREEFRPDLVDLQQGVELALLARGAGPTVLADVGDNVGGGAPGSTTHVLRALHEAGARGAVVVLHDPPAVSLAGSGGAVELVVGEPAFPVNGRVTYAGEVRYRRSGTYMTGSEVDLGACAVVDCGTIEVVLTSRRAMPFDLDHLRAVGIEPAERRILVAKSAIAWQAAFGDVAGRALYLDTPGPCTCRLDTLPYENLRRPIFPLDAR